ncbi:HdeD family acid-resistance protein [Catenulispora pinistramenti]|nr:HdeD family acid-resistance protein [Catenulispora pinistramenti]
MTDMYDGDDRGTGRAEEMRDGGTAYREGFRDREGMRDGEGMRERASDRGFGGADRGDRVEAENPLRILGQAAWQALMVLGLAAIAIGVCAVVWPGRTLLVLGVLFGIYLLISGVMEIIAAFGDHISPGMRVLNVIVGAVSILLGLFCFRNSLHNSVLLLSLWIGIGFLMWGIATIATSASAPPGVLGRGWGMFAGFMTMLGGIIIISWPIGSIFTLAIFTGIWLIAIGLVEVIHAFTLRGKVRQTTEPRSGSGRHATV